MYKILLTSRHNLKSVLNGISMPYSNGYLEGLNRNIKDEDLTKSQNEILLGIFLLLLYIDFIFQKSNYFYSFYIKKMYFVFFNKTY